MLASRRAPSRRVLDEGAPGAQYGGVPIGLWLSGFVIFGSAPLPAAGGQAATDPSATALPAGVSMSISVSDIDPLPLSSLGTWFYPIRYPSSAPMFGPSLPLFPRLKLNLPTVFGLQPFVNTVFRTTGPFRLPSSDFGFTVSKGPFEFGTRFNAAWDPATGGLSIVNRSYTRYVERTWDLGLATLTERSLLAARATTRSTVSLSAGVHPLAEALTVRVNSGQLAAGGAPSPQVMAFGRF